MGGIFFEAGRLFWIELAFGQRPLRNEDVEATGRLAL